MTTRIWTGGGTTSKPKSGKWNTAADWSPAGVPAAGDDVIFGGSSAYTVTLNVNTVSLNSLTITDSSATFAVASFTLNVSGTSASAINLVAGHITISGGTINDAGGLALASGSTVSGAGTLKISGHYTGTGAIQANGGILDIFGTIDSGIALQISSGSVSILKIEGTATAATAIAISSVRQTLEIGTAGNLSINAVESITKGKIQLDGGILTIASGLSIGSGALLAGSGIVIAPLSGSGTVSANGGTLDLTGTVSSGLALTIATTAGSTLKINGTATAASAISISSVNQTLEVGAAGNLTIAAAESITNGTIKIDGGALTDGSGIIDGAGAHLTGFGVITAGTTAATDVDGTGAITASGGVLEFKTLVDGTTASAFDIANVAGSVLKFDAAVGTASIKPTITFDGVDGGVGEAKLAYNPVCQHEAAGRPHDLSQ